MYCGGAIGDALDFWHVGDLDNGSEGGCDVVAIENILVLHTDSDVFIECGDLVDVLVLGNYNSFFGKMSKNIARTHDLF